MKIMYLLTALLLFVTSAPLFSQTKFIAHKSHSGTSETFTLAHAGNMGLCGGWIERSIDTTSEDTLTRVAPPAAKTRTPNVIPPSAPALPDTIVQPNAVEQEPAVIDTLKPNISDKSEQPTPGTASLMRNESERTPENRTSSLLLLALALGLPTSGVLLFNIRRKGHDLG